MVRRSEIEDKITAGTAILDAGGTVFHATPPAGRLSSLRVQALASWL
jgi:hypothetical protein